MPTNEKRDEEICFALFVIAALIGFYQLIYTPVTFTLGNEMVAIARNVAVQGAYANPEAVSNTGPTAANPPLYPLFLALLMKVFRVPLYFFGVASLCNIVANALTASLLPRVSKLFYGNTAPGIVGAALWMASMQLTPSWDTGITLLILLIFFLYSNVLFENEKGFVQPLIVGVLLGLLFLANPSTLLIVMPWIVYRVILKKISLSQAAIIMSTLLLVMSVWVVRNDIQLGSPVVRSNFGFALYVSNNDCAEPSWYEEELNNCHPSHHPNGSLSEAKMMQSMGEVAYSHKRGSDAMQWIKSHPKRFLVLFMKRYRNFWFPPLSENPVQGPAIWLATALSIPGLILMIKRRESVTLFVLTVMFIYPIMYCVVISDVRYRYPEYWLSLLPAGYFVNRFYSRFARCQTV